MPVWRSVVCTVQKNMLPNEPVEPPTEALMSTSVKMLRSGHIRWIDRTQHDLMYGCLTRQLGENEDKSKKESDWHGRTGPERLRVSRCVHANERIILLGVRWSGGVSRQRFELVPLSSL